MPRSTDSSTSRSDARPIGHLDASLLAPLPSFAGLDRAAIRDILDLASSSRIAEEQTVFEEGAEASR